MSQIFKSSMSGPLPPSVPTLFTENTGTATPSGNNLNIFGTIVAAGTHPLTTVGSGSTVTIETQYAQAIAATNATNVGLAAFNSAQFTVDANGFVSITSSTPLTFQEDSGTAAPAANVITFHGAIVAAGVQPLTTIGSGSTVTIQTQYSQAAAATNAAHAGLSSFNSAFFTVDANGFVSANGTGLAQTITGNSGGALSPTAGNWNILGAAVAAGSTPVTTVGSVSTLTIDVQRAQAIVATNASNVGLAAFNSAQFTVDANGFVSTSGTGILNTLTPNSGTTPVTPTGGTINVVGTGSITTVGSANTVTIELTGLTNHAVLVGAGTPTITSVGPTATSGQVLQSQGAAADPAFSTATYPATTTINQILYSSSANVVTGLATANNGVLTTGTSGIPVITALAANGQLIIGSGSGAPAAATLTAGTGITITNAANSITIATTNPSGFPWTDVTGATQTLAVNNGYVTDHTNVTYTLPASAALGDTMKIVGKLGITTIAQNANQQILMGSASSTVGVGGSVAGTNVGDSIELICITAGASTVWRAASWVGNWTVT
jgi:hypothetical protein